jgi:hypothetical protein
MTWHDQDLRPPAGAAATTEGDSHDRHLDVSTVRAGPGSGTAWYRHPRGTTAAEELPPGPGTATIPAGHIRLWHYTPLGKVPSIREHGLLRSKARGDAGNGDQADPSTGVRALTRRPDDILENHDGGAAVIEYHAHPAEISQNAEHYWHQDPQEWAKGYHHVIMRGDVPPDQIVAIHEPWHGAARYMRDDDPALQRYQWVKDEADPVYEPYKRGLQALECRATAARAAGPRSGGGSGRPCGRTAGQSRLPRAGPGPAIRPVKPQRQPAAARHLAHATRGR